MRNTIIRDYEKAKLKRVTINVTKRDIAKGKRGLCHTCPVALAVNRLLKKPFRSVVGTIAIKYEHITEGGSVYGPNIPINATQFIHNFDDYKNPAPFKFRMSIPKMVLKNP